MNRSALFLCIFLPLHLFAQTLPKRPKLRDVRNYNQFNLMQVNIGMSKDSVVSVMGGTKLINVYDPDMPMGFKNVGKIANPYSRDVKRDTVGHVIEILWYYTDKKHQSNSILKEDLTPIVFDNNAVVGIGWGFYTDYSKIKNYSIDVSAN